MPDLFELSQLAKTEKESAAVQLLSMMREIFPALALDNLRINSSAVSLNSVNGFVEVNGEEMFFKFHAEEGEDKTMEEFYRSELLFEAGYPILMPAYRSTEPGKQIVIYPKIEAPTMYDKTLELDRQFVQTGKYDEALSEQMLALEGDYCDRVAERMIGSLHLAIAEDVAQEGINQLFFRRLQDPRTTPRVELFYRGKEVRLLSGETLAFDELAQKRWVINGVEFAETLAEAIERSTALLDPMRLPEYAAVSGHGDDHNGNKFVTREGVLLFDAAFAGANQYALLTPVKTSFHDTLAHPFWLYQSGELPLALECLVIGDQIVVTHDFVWSERSPLRKQLLDIKRNQLWLPLLRELKSRGWLEDNWQDYVRAAFFACPFLVYNLIDPGKFSPDKSVFALSQCVRLASASADGLLNDFIQQLRGALDDQK